MLKRKALKRKVTKSKRKGSSTCCPVFCAKGSWSLICFYFIFQMQENANELQYPEAAEVSDPQYTNRSAALHPYVCTSVDKLNLCVWM